MFWCYSLVGEEFDGECETKEEAIEVGNEEAWDNEQDHFWVGEAKAFIPEVDVDYVIDRLRDQAWCQCGEAADGFLDVVVGSHFEELEKNLNDVLQAWVAQYYKPHFHGVEHISEISVTAPAEGKSCDG
jgi:hypothetical protein